MNNTNSSYHTGIEFSLLTSLFRDSPKTKTSYEINEVSETPDCEDKKLPFNPPQRFCFLLRLLKCEFSDGTLQDI